MSNIFLNKSTKFKCKGGNGVFFKVRNGDSLTKINGEGVLSQDCILELVGTPHPGQCNMIPDPSTGAPSPCKALTVGGNWNNTSNVKVSGKRMLGSECSINCPLVMTEIIPFAPTYRGNNVDDRTSDFVVSIGAVPATPTSSLNSSKVFNSGSENAYVGSGISEKSETASGKNEESDKREKNYEYALCDYKNCDKAEECEYLKTGCELAETDESINAAQLKNNIGRDEFDLYAMECGNIATTLFKFKKDEFNTYSVAHHHIIPANQCFKQYPEIVKLGNYYGYDINNAKNGICLPTMNQGYDGQDLDLKLEIAFEAMEKLGKQWHKGPHGYSSLTYKINQAIDELFIDCEPIKDYKTSVDEYLEQFRGRLESENKCRAENYEKAKTEFCAAMDHISGKIANKLRKFETEPKKSHSFFVSKIALYYAYNELLNNNKELFFGKEE